MAISNTEHSIHKENPDIPYSKQRIVIHTFSYKSLTYCTHCRVSSCLMNRESKGEAYVTSSGYSYRILCIIPKNHEPLIELIDFDIDESLMLLCVSVTWHFFRRAFDRRSMSSQSIFQFLMLSARTGSSWRGMYSEHWASIACSWIRKYFSSDWLASKSSSLGMLVGSRGRGVGDKDISEMRYSSMRIRSAAFSARVTSKSWMCCLIVRITPLLPSTYSHLTPLSSSEVPLRLWTALKPVPRLLWQS